MKSETFTHFFRNSGYRRFWQLLVLLLLFQIPVLNAQTATNNAPNSGGNIFPFGSSATKKVQQIYLPGEMVGSFAGNITAVYFRANAASTGATYANFRITLGQTTTTTFTGNPATYFTGGTVVLNVASQVIPAVAANGWFRIPLTTPFLYDPTRTLIVIVDHTAATGSITVATSAPGGTNYRRIFAANPTDVSGTSDQSWYNFGVDILPAGDIGVSNVSLMGSSGCQGSSASVRVRVRNFESVDTARNPILGYSLNGGPQVVDTFFVTLPPGRDSLYTFKLPVTFNNSGTNTVRVSSLRPDKNAANDTSSSSIFINPAPQGSVVTAGVPFQGTFNTGTIINPDIVKGGDQLNYMISPPTGFNNSNYGTTWDILVSMRTRNGVVIPASQFTITPPGANNARITFNPTNAFTDSSVVMTITIRELGPNLCGTLIARNIFIAPEPVVNFSANGVCLGDITLFNNLSLISSGTLSYSWNFGDGKGTSANTTPFYKYLNFGVFPVRLTATSNFGYSKDTIINVTVFEAPNVNFSRVNACQGDSVIFVNNSSIGTGSLTYSWNFGDGKTTNVTNPRHFYQNTGGYNVTLTATSGGCSRSIDKFAYHFPKPVASFGSTGNCSNSAVSFTGTSTIQSGKIGYHWDFNDGTLSTEKNPSHVFTGHGTKNVKLVATSEFGCMDSTTQSIVILESPVANFMVTKACSIDPVTFANNSTSPGTPNYFWNFGDGSTSVIENPSHKFSNPGSKTVSLRVTSSNGCAHSITKPVVVKIQPIADFSVEPGCQGNEIPFVNKSVSPVGSLTYLWRFGDNSTSSVQSPTHVYNSSSNFDVTLISYLVGGCVDSIKKQVVINKIPSCDFNMVSNFTGDRKVNFIPSEAGLNYFWTFGDGGSSGIQQPLYQYGFDGNFNVNLFAINSAGCECSMTKQINMKKTGVQDLNSSDDKVSVYPNPGAGVFNLEFTKKADSDIKLSVYSLLGGLVKTLEFEKHPNGNISFDLDNQPNGIYIVKIETEGNIINKKITLSR